MRLIDADKLKEFINKQDDDDPIIYKGDLLILIDKINTADTTPVVRCGNCKWFARNLCLRHCGLAMAHEDSYCSYGENKDEIN